MGNRKCIQTFGWKSRTERAAWRNQEKMREDIKIYVTEVEFEDVVWNFVAECREKCRGYANQVFNL
jgi:hypothetical protein